MLVILKVQDNVNQILIKYFGILKFQDAFHYYTITLKYMLAILNDQDAVSIS